MDSGRFCSGWHSARRLAEYAPDERECAGQVSFRGAANEYRGGKVWQLRRLSRALEIDLCGKDGRALDKAAQKFVPFARKVARESAPRRTVSSRQHSADVRDWARTQGMVISDRGRIPADVERKFAAAH